MFWKKKQTEEGEENTEKVKSEPVLKRAAEFDATRAIFNQFFEDPDDPFVEVNRKLSALGREVEDIVHSQDMILDAINNLAERIDQDKDELYAQRQKQHNDAMRVQKKSGDEVEKEEPQGDNSSALAAGAAGGAGVLAGKSILKWVGRGLVAVGSLIARHPAALAVGIAAYGGYKLAEYLTSDEDDTKMEKPKAAKPSAAQMQPKSLGSRNAPQLQNIKTSSTVRFESAKEIRFKANRIRFEAGVITGVGSVGGQQSSSPSKSSLDMGMSHRLDQGRMQALQAGASGTYSGSMDRWSGSLPELAQPSPGMNPGLNYTPIPKGPQQSQAPWLKTPQSRPLADTDAIPHHGTGGSAYLAQKRSHFREELNAKPELRYKLARLLQAETGASSPAAVESLFNRLELIEKQTGQRVSIEDYLNRTGKNQFYGPLRKGHLPQINDKQYKALDAQIEAALKGSNVIRGATDQGSGNDPNVRHEGGRIVMGGEVYNDFGGVKGGHAAAKAWREQRAREIEQADREKGSDATPASRVKVSDEVQQSRARFLTGEMTLPAVDGMPERKIKVGSGGGLYSSIPFGTHDVSPTRKAGPVVSGLTGTPDVWHVGTKGSDFQKIQDDKEGRSRTAIQIHQATQLDKLYSNGCIVMSPKDYQIVRAQLTALTNKHGAVLLDVLPSEKGQGHAVFNIRTGKEGDSSRVISADKAAESFARTGHVNPQDVPQGATAETKRETSAVEQQPNQSRPGAWTALSPSKAEAATLEPTPPKQPDIEPTPTPAPEPQPPQQMQQVEQPKGENTPPPDLSLYEMHPDPVYNSPKVAPPIVPKDRKSMGKQDNHFVSGE